MKRQGLPILMYHAIERERDVLATDPGWFATTMDALADAGFRTIDLEDWVRNGRPHLERTFAITFDDGLRSVWNAADVLARHRFTATVFLVTGRLGAENHWPGQPRTGRKRALIDWDEVADLAAAGFRFGSHTCTHPNLRKCSELRIDDELRLARAGLESRLGRACGLLAYPYGAACERVQRAAARHYDAAFGARLSCATSADNRYAIARIDAFYLRSERALERLICGRLHGWLRVRRALRRVRRTAAALYRQDALVYEGV
jgi:peptidoglycan/xylan/chitin deacetylase (PgdA/CDA1 family)